MGTVPALYAELLGDHAGRPARNASKGAVVALHGISSGGVSWRPSLGPLGPIDEASIWLPDLLGHGRSPYPTDACYDVDDHLAALTAWAGATLPQTAPLTLVGCSFGAVLAAEWARRLPVQRVNAVILTCLPLFDTAAEARASFATSDLLTWLTVCQPRLAETICRRTCGPHGIVTRAARLAAPRGWKSNHQAWRAFPEAMFLHSWESLSRSLQRCLIAHRVQPAVRELAYRGTRINFVHGDRDRLAPIAAIQALTDEVGAPVVRIPGGTHALQLTHTTIIRRSVRNAFQNPASHSATAMLT